MSHRHPPLPGDVKARVIELRAAGVMWKDISAETGIRMKRLEILAAEIRASGVITHRQTRRWSRADFARVNEMIVAKSDVEQIAAEFGCTKAAASDAIRRARESFISPPPAPVPAPVAGDRRARIIRLRREGVTWPVIARKIGVSADELAEIVAELSDRLPAEMPKVSVIRDVRDPVLALRGSTRIPMFQGSEI